MAVVEVTVVIRSIKGEGMEVMMEVMMMIILEMPTMKMMEMKEDFSSDDWYSPR